MSSFELESFERRLSLGLRHRKLRLDTHTSSGVPTTVKLRNPFEIVADSSNADLVLYLYVTGFEQGEVSVTTDRVVFWNSFGIAQSWVGYERVSRTLIEVDAQLKEVATGQTFTGFRSRGASVGETFKRGSLNGAIERCEIRIYERLLRR